MGTALDNDSRDLHRNADAHTWRRLYARIVTILVLEALSL